MRGSPTGAARLYRAAWVLPLAGPPIPDGWILVRDGRIEGVGGGRRPEGAPARDVDLGAAAILPGLVNAHTHLELSALRGRVPKAPSMPVWVCDLLTARRPGPPSESAIAEAIAEAHRTGTTLVGDISNTLATVGPLAASPLSAVVFREVIGFNSRDPSRLVRNAVEAIDRAPTTATVRASLAVHAPYSCGPGLIRAVRGWLDQSGRGLTSVHLGESSEEVEFLKDGRGPWRDLLESLHAWTPDWTPPGTDPVSYVDALGFLKDGVLVVHGVQFEEPALARLRARGATLVTCPRSNQWVGVGPPPLQRFYDSGVPVAVGTDSLASVGDLNLFAELKEMRRLAPAVPPRVLLASATHVGATALGFAQDLGAIAPGRRAALIAVDVPPDVGDVEEYLVQGIQPSAIRWVED